jgi:hypothetical protein
VRSTGAGSDRCADLSRAAGEALIASAVTARAWLVLEVPGSWPRDVSTGETLSKEARQAVGAWLAETPGSRLQFVRRPARTARNLLAFLVQADEATRGMRRLELAEHDDLAAIDLDRAGEPVEASLVLVCGHGTRDQCCALRGPAVYGRLFERLGDEELWFSSHQGGHRFAPNVLVLPDGLQFGRVEPVEAPLLVARALARRIELGRYRGRTCYEPVVQAAEHAIRTQAGFEGVDDLRLAGAEGRAVRFRGFDGSNWEALVEETMGPSVPASCAAEPEPQRTLRARLV